MRLQFLTINALSGALENPTTLQSRKLLRGMPAQKQRELAELVRIFKKAHDDVLSLRIEKSRLLAEFCDVQDAQPKAEVRNYGELIGALDGRVSLREKDLGELKARILRMLNPRTSDVASQQL